VVGVARVDVQKHRDNGQASIAVKLLVVWGHFAHQWDRIAPNEGLQMDNVGYGPVGIPRLWLVIFRIEELRLKMS
jgi:hypothetical protein